MEEQTQTPAPVDDEQIKKMMKQEQPSFVERNLYQAVTLILIAINVVVYIIEFWRSGFSTEISSQVLLEMGAMFAPVITSPVDLYRLITPMFLHMDVLHLLFNMVALYSVGVTLERILGHGNFLLLYLIGGITGNAVCYAASMISGDNALSAGASTSVFGLFVAVVMLAVLFKGNRRVISQYSRSMLAIIVINIVYTLLVPNISIAGHLGGAVGGLIAMFIIPCKNLRVANAVRIIVAILWIAVLVFLFYSQGVFTGDVPNVYITYS